MANRISLRSVGRPSGRPGSASVSRGDASISSFRKRKEWSRRGVSDIIGNLLILAITVTLFTSILYFVSSLPTPTAKIYGDFSGSIDYSPDKYCNIEITHRGGEELLDSQTKIYLIANGNYSVRKISESTPSIGTTWSLGSTWTYNDTVTPALLKLYEGSSLEAMIVNTEKNVVVWSGILLDNSPSSSTPIVLERFLAHHVAEDIYLEGSSDFQNKEQVMLYVHMYDGGNDLRSVYANVSSLGGLAEMPLIDTDSNNWYTAAFQIVTTSLGPKTITIGAVDSGGRTAVSTLSVNIIPTPRDTNWTGGNGQPPGNLYFSNLQGINLFRYQEWMDYSYGANATSQFQMSDEKAVVIVASKFLVNLENANELLILNQKKEVDLDVSTPKVQFVTYDYYSGYYLYQAIVDLTKLTDNTYYFAKVQLRDSLLPVNNQFFAMVPFTIGASTSPTIETYSDPSCQEKETNFTTNSIIYVKITNAPLATWNQYAGLVQITDYGGNTQIKRMPDDSIANPVSNLTKVSPSVYTFEINLSAANQSPWIPGNAAYMLRYDVFQVGDQPFLLGKMVNISSPKIILDLVAGSVPVSVGWASGSLIEYYTNNNQWVPPDYIQGWDGKHQTDLDMTKFVRVADVNGNGKLDVIAVVTAGSVDYITIYQNDGAWTPITVEETGRGTITAITMGALDKTEVDDIIVGYDNGKVAFYRNDGTWGYNEIGQVLNSRVTSLVAIDVLNTVVTYGAAQSMNVIAGFSSSATNTYPIHIFTNLDLLGTRWDDTPYIGQVSNIETTNAQGESPFVDAYKVYGDYLSSRYGSGDYQELSEVNSTKPVETWTKVPALESPFVVPPGSKSWNEWTYWDTVPTSPIDTVYLEVSYSVEFKKSDTAPYFDYTLPGSVTPVRAGPLTSSASNVISFPLAGVTDANQLWNLTITLTNPLSKPVTCNYIRLVVTYQADVSVMSHEWTFTTTSGGTNTLDFNAATSGIGDGFRLQYSTDGGNTYNNFVPDLIVTSVAYARYSYDLPLTSGSQQFKVRIVDLDRMDGPETNTTIQIKNLCINTTLLTTGTIGLPITDLQVHDMNLDGYDDLIIADGQDIWICYNDQQKRKNSLISELPTQATGGSNQIPNIINIGVGVLSSNTPYPGIIVAAGNAAPYKIFTIEPSSTNPKVWNDPVEKFSLNAPIKKLVGADIDGDGDVDFVMLTNTKFAGTDVSKLEYYRNDGSGSFSVWTIDTMPFMVNDISLGKVQNN